MYLTTLGFLVVPLGLILFFMPIRFLISAVILFAPFGAASVLNADEPFIFGVQPGLYLSGLVVMRLAVSLLARSGSRISRRADPLYVSLIAFVLYAVVTGLFLPRIFQGVDVFQPRGGLDTPFPQPLESSGTNVTQGAYLLCYGALALALPSFLGRYPAQTVRLIRLFVKTFWVVAFLAFYDIFSLIFNLPNLVWLFENPMYGRLAHSSLQMVGGAVRPEATFPEPSVLCQYLVCIFSCALGYCLRVRPTKEMIAVVATSSLIIAMTLSATGIFGAGVMLVVCLAVATDAKRTLLGAAAFLVFAICLLLVLPEMGVDIFWLLNKGQTISFEHRTRTDLLSARLLLETYGLGVGLGSNRSSSLFLSVASNVGVIGMAIGVTLIAKFHRQVSFFARHASAPESEWLWPIYLGFVGSCVAGAIAVPDLSSMSLWLPLGLGISLAKGVGSFTPPPRPAAAAASTRGFEALVPQGVQS